VLVHDPSELHGTRSKSSVRWTAGAYNIMSDFSKLVLGMDYDKKLAWEDERKDELGCLTFTTEPLDKDIEITGPLTLSFWAETKFGKPVENSKLYQFLSSVFASTGNPLHPDANNLKAVTEEKDVQWVVEINDVSSDGRAKNITSGWLRASHRPYDLEDDRNVDKNYIPFDPFYDGPDRQPKRIKEGERYHYVVEVWPTSNVFKKGHRIRVSISGSDYPHLMPIMVPSNNTLVINESHKAKLEFSSVNTKNENKTWKWVKEKNINNYLRK
jgi:predicted acyl esterase